MGIGVGKKKFPNSNIMLSFKENLTKQKKNTCKFSFLLLFINKF